MNEIEDAANYSKLDKVIKVTKFKSSPLNQKCPNAYCTNRFGEGQFEIIDFFISAKNMKGFALVLCSPCASKLKDIVNGNC